jgi:hypothetical protein
MLIKILPGSGGMGKPIFMEVPAGVWYFDRKIPETAIMKIHWKRVSCT